MTDNPLLLLLLGAAGIYFGKLWLDDMRAARAGRPNPRALPGATPARRSALWIASTGALALLAIETAGEHTLGIATEQSTMTWLFALYTLTAAIIEEIIFRGYLVIENRGTATRWAGILTASVVFALVHPFLWKWDDTGFALTFGVKGAFSTAIVFATSVWLYLVRFARWNPTHSLLPCIVAHAAKNAGVIVIKASSGFMGGLW